MSLDKWEYSLLYAAQVKSNPVCWIQCTVGRAFLPSGLRRVCRIQSHQTLTHSSQVPLGFWLTTGSRRFMRIWQAFCRLERATEQWRIKGQRLPHDLALTQHLSLHSLPSSDAWCGLSPHLGWGRDMTIPCGNDADVEFWESPQKMRGAQKDTMQNATPFSQFSHTNYILICFCVNVSFEICQISSNAMKNTIQGNEHK